MHRHLIIASCLLPLPALACPTAADLDTGIRIYDRNGGSEVFRRLNSDVVEAIYTDEDGFASRTQLGQGLYLLEYTDLENGAVLKDSRETYVFAMSPRKMPQPQANTEWRADVVLRSADGLQPETQTYRIGPIKALKIGTCSYDAMEVTLTYAPGPDNEQEKFQFIPALGFSYITEFRDDAGVDKYRYTRIEAVGNRT